MSGMKPDLQGALLRHVNNLSVRALCHSVVTHTRICEQAVESRRMSVATTGDRFWLLWAGEITEQGRPGSDMHKTLR